MIKLNSLRTVKSVNKGLMNTNIKSYANTACELGGSNSVREGFTQHINRSALVLIDILGNLRRK